MENKRNEWMNCFFRSEEGTETVEWAVLAGFLLIVAVAGWPFIGEAVKNRIAVLLEAIT